MKKLIEKTWSYILYQTDDNNLIFSVVCGTVGLYQRNIQLNEKEKSEFEKQGQNYLEVLAEHIRQSADEYKPRHIQEITP